MLLARLSLLALLPVSHAYSQTDAQNQANNDVISQADEVIEVVNHHEFLSANYQVLHREDFIDASQTLSDVLSTVNGIQIRQISGIGNPVAISIRGSSSKQVQFYIDGELVNDGQFGSFDLNQIPTEQIESIEISKSQAIGTGATPIGGVIRINTYNPTENKAKASVSLGSFGYKEASLLVNKAFKDHSLAIGGSYLASDNNYDFLVPQSYQNSSESITEPLRNNEFEKKSIFVNDTAVLGQHQLRFNIQYNNQDKALANYQNNSPENNSSIENENLRFGYQHQWSSDLSWLSIVEFEFYHDKKDEFYLDSPDGKRSNTSEYNTIKNYAGLNGTIEWQALNFTPYITVNEQEFSSASQRNGVPSQCNGISACDIYAEQQQLNIGSRLVWHDKSLPFSGYFLVNQLNEKNSSVAVNLTNATPETTNNHYNTQEVGLNYQIADTAFLINWSNGIRTPTLFELFGDRGSFKGNDNLLPEEAQTATFSVEYTHNNLALSSSIYQQSLTNSIVAIFNASGVGSYNNVSSAEVKGIELQGSIKLTTSLFLLAQAQANECMPQAHASSAGLRHNYRQPRACLQESMRQANVHPLFHFLYHQQSQ